MHNVDKIVETPHRGGELLNTQKKALLVVDKDFDVAHVGVRRVLSHLVSELRGDGIVPDLASFSKGGLHLLENNVLVNELVTSVDSFETEITWKNGEWLGGKVASRTLLNSRAVWSETTIKQSDYLISVLTTPWLAAEMSDSKFEQSFTFGIIYDVIPNLIAGGMLTFERWMDVLDFAHAHHVGFQHYLKYTTKILTISENSKRDFLSLYPKVGENRVGVFTPFVQVQRDIAYVPEAGRVLVVNSLDYRKNFNKILDALGRMDSAKDLELVFVGRERVPVNIVEDFLNSVRPLVKELIWYRWMDDSDLVREIQSSAVLLFPSLYEGLGLPILEAQALGLPVISSNGSSCGELNMNPTLQVDVDDGTAIANALERAVVSPETLISNSKLISKQSKYLQNATTFISFTR